MISRHVRNYSGRCGSVAGLSTSTTSKNCAHLPSVPVPNRLSNKNQDVSQISKRFVSWMRFTPVVTQSTQLRYRSGDNNKLGETSIMRQEGTEIQEVPLAVLKQSNDEPTGLAAAKSYIELDKREEAAFVEGFNSYNSPQQILKMLDTIPSQEVTPFVGVSILKKLFELENNFGFRNDGLQWTISSESSATDTFARSAIVTRLVDTIVTSEDANILLGALNALKCERNEHDNKTVSDASSPNSLTNEGYRKKIFDEVLLRVTQGKFTLNQACEAIISLGKMKSEKKNLPVDLIDKLWIGIIENSNDIDVEIIDKVFRTLPHFVQSRRVVLNLAEKKLLAVWWKMDIEKVAKICSVVVADKNLSQKNFDVRGSTSKYYSLGVSNRALSALSQCTSLNIHKVTETDLLTIVQSFHALNFCDESIEKALNKYMKAKGLKINDPALVAAVMSFAKKNHIRSPMILEAAAEYVVMHKGANLSPPQFSSIVSTFGHLDFQPPNSVKFWQTVEGFLNEKFIQFPPKDVIDVFLSCVYLMKFPLNFIDRIFSPYFLDRLHSNDMNYSFLQNLRSRLKLLDSAFTIECPSKYGGPMLPKDFTARSVFVDGRILRMCNSLEDTIKDIFENKVAIEKSTLLPNLPLNHVYMADILLSNTKTSDSDSYSYLKNRISTRINTGVTPTDNLRDLTVILIHLPDHFTRDGNNLIGPEVMRIRHLQLLGFNVATMKYESLAQMKMHPEALRDYIKERLKDAGCVW